MKIDSHLTNFIVYDLETHNMDRARPYVFCFYRLSNLAGRYNPDLTQDEKQNSEKDTMAFDGDNCLEKTLDSCLQLKGEGCKDNKNKIQECNCHMHEYNGSGFDTLIVLNNLSCDKRIVNIIKNGRGNIELKIFNGYIEKNKKHIPQYLNFRCFI